MIFKIPSAGLTGDSSTMQSSAGADRLKNNSQTQFISDETKPTWLFWIQTCFEEKENKLQKQQSETYLPIRCLYSKRLDTCLWRGVSHTFLVRSLWRSVNNLFSNYCWSWHEKKYTYSLLCLLFFIPSNSFERLRFSPSTADTDWLLGSLALFEGETVSWLNRFLLTFVTSVKKTKTL